MYPFLFVFLFFSFFPSCFHSLLSSYPHLLHTEKFPKIPYYRKVGLFFVGVITIIVFCKIGHITCFFFSVFVSFVFFFSF